MNKIWMNRLIAGTQKWCDVPQSRRTAIKALLQEGVENRSLTQEQYDEIVKED